MEKENRFNPDSFKLVQSNTRIMDKKLESRPTTFAKDAFRRFCKNKSSVIAAIILAILILLTIVVPVVSPYNITNVNTTEKFLAPKLFESGTGFWDGTRKSERVVYDRANGVPAVSDKYSIASLQASLVSISVDPEPTLIDAANIYGSNGFVMMATDAAVDGKDVYMMSKDISFTAAGGYRLKIKLDAEDDVQGSRLGEYRVFLKSKDGTEIIVRDFSSDYSEIDFDISKALSDAGKTALNAQVVFDLKSSADAFRYILVESVELTTESGKNAEQLKAVSFTDATQMVVLADKNADGYWACSGRKGVHNSVIYYCDYVIDTYELVYGNADLVTYSATELKRWVDAGWCEYDEKAGPESFKRLTDDCPIDEVVEQSVNSRTKKLNSITGRGYNFRKMGYKSMPKFLLGTDASGFDLFKRAFAGLRTSLILGLCTAAFCFAFGLVWGAVSGYFGGNVDLFMERFCDILGGIPWIVMMTLFILHLGNNFFTFFLALCMTGWMGTAHRTRTQFYRFKGREYVLASRTLGSSDMRLIFKHILPNSMGTIITASVLMIPSTIYSEATLAYLNLGLQGVQSFGVMMSNNQQYLSIYPNLVIFPAVVMALMMVSFNLFGNGLRDAFNPSLKGSE
ncbi:MAG: ABC transporter permease subunit [Clostridia bacterium]|nr:ABC transporter permease subunit [Clostridia bacterium]MCR4576776.1 ABC transporter permease subunit [Clostridiales bacterium]